MIIDNARLAGASAYLQAADGSTNIALAQPALGVVEGSFQVRAEGTLVEVESVDLLLGAKNLVDLLQRQPAPIVSIGLDKEMFPGLHADPYRHRVQSIGGNEDFLRGVGKNARVMEIEGIPVIVSTGGSDCSWRSAVYRFDDPVTIAHAAWDLATSRLTPEDGFRYGLELETWSPAVSPSGPPDGQVTLATDQSPTAKRCLTFQATTVTAYQIVFRADVRHDAYLRERHIVLAGDASLGRPLLRSVNLLEQVEPAHDFHSILELGALSGSPSLVQQPPAPPGRLLLNLPLAAVLTVNEGMRIRAPASQWEVLEARLNARVSLRPPVTDQRD